MTTIISVENLSKSYRLGQIGTGTFAHDLNAWWAKARGKPNPLLRIGEMDHGNRDGEELWALRDVSFTVKQGEVLGIIGRNGAGKSTLLKILSGITAPTSGKIKVRGNIASLLEVGTGFHPEMTGRENIYLNGAIMGMNRREIERKFDEMVDFSGVEQFIDTPVKRYSSGMYVRLAFAVAAHLDPEILVVDEVLAVGDAEFQKKCLGKMGEVAKSGRTILFVSHNMGMVKNLCPTVKLLENGSISFHGPTEEGVSRYLWGNSSENENASLELVLENNKDVNHEKVSLKKISLIQNGESVRSIVDSSIPLEIRIAYELYQDIRPFRLKMRFLTDEGIAFHTDDTLGNQSLEARKAGMYVATCVIPSDFLNTKRYQLILGVDEPSLAILIPFVPLLSFDVVDVSGRARYTQNWPGAVRPYLKWAVLQE